jgi:hypothetical protein
MNNELVKYTIEFEAPAGWVPNSLGCWICCPFSVLLKLGDICPGRKNDKLCPIERKAMKNGV